MISIDLDEEKLLSEFQLPKPFGFALKSPNFGPVCTGGGDRIDSGADVTGGGLYFGLTGEKLGPEYGPSSPDHDAGAC